MSGVYPLHPTFIPIRKKQERLNIDLTDDVLERAKFNLDCGIQNFEHRKFHVWTYSFSLLLHFFCPAIILPFMKHMVPFKYDILLLDASQVLQVSHIFTLCQSCLSYYSTQQSFLCLTGSNFL